MEQPERDAHACIDGITGLETTHPQVPMFYYTCDKDIAGLISIMNYCGVHTVNSCQDNRYNRGSVPRVWVEILGEHFIRFLSMLDRPDEASDIESLSNRMAPAHHPDDPYYRGDFEEDPAWHYRPQIQRVDGQLIPLTMSVRFPATDLPVVVERLRAAAKELDGRVVPQSPDRDTEAWPAPLQSPGVTKTNAIRTRGTQPHPLFEHKPNPSLHLEIPPRR